MLQGNLEEAGRIGLPPPYGGTAFRAARQASCLRFHGGGGGSRTRKAASAAYLGSGQADLLMYQPLRTGPRICPGIFRS